MSKGPLLAEADILTKAYLCSNQMCAVSRVYREEGSITAKDCSSLVSSSAAEA